MREKFLPCACLCFWALTEGARRATGVSAQNHSATRRLLAIFVSLALFLPHRLPLEFDLMRGMHQPVQDAVGHCGVADLGVPRRDRQLAGQQHRTRLIALVADLQELLEGADSDNVDQSFRSHADQIGAKRRRALSL